MMATIIEQIFYKLLLKLEVTSVYSVWNLKFEAINRKIILLKTYILYFVSCAYLISWKKAPKPH